MLGFFMIKITVSKNIELLSFNYICILNQNQKNEKINFNRFCIYYFNLL